MSGAIPPLALHALITRKGTPLLRPLSKLTAYFIINYAVLQDIIYTFVTAGCCIAVRTYELQHSATNSSERA